MMGATCGSGTATLAFISPQYTPVFFRFMLLNQSLIFCVVCIIFLLIVFLWSFYSLSFSEVYVAWSLVFCVVFCRSLFVFSEVYVARSLVFCVVFCRSLFVFIEVYVAWSLVFCVVFCRSLFVFSEVYVAWSLVFCVVFCRSLFVFSGFMLLDL